MSKLKRYYYIIVVYILQIYQNYYHKKYKKLFIKLRNNMNKYPSLNDYNELNKNGNLKYYWNTYYKMYDLIFYYKTLSTKPVIYDTITID